MEIIYEADSVVKEILGKQTLKHENYKLFPYVVEHEYQNSIFFYHVLTKELLLLTKSEAEYCKDFANAPLDFKEKLIEKWFFIPENEDARQICEFVRKSIRKQDIIQGKYYQFTIFPTMECNARCKYCFEAGKKREKMDTKVALDVANYIVTHSKENYVKLKWFGGEPLMNIEAIDSICTYLAENGIAYESDMVSNGYLFSESVALQAVNDWNLKSIQITLDGTEDVYNRTKNYVYQKENAFCRVIQNISLLLKEHIYVRIRLNMVSGSLVDMQSLIDFLLTRFGNSNYLKIYAVEVFDANKNDLSKKNNTLWKEVSQINRYIDEKGFGYSYSLSQKLRVNYCMADSDNAITILPNGNLGKCEYYSDSDIWGNIYCDTYHKEVIEAWKEIYADKDKCKECFLFPDCLHLKKCPEAFSCNGNVEYKKKQIQKEIERIYYEMCVETQDMEFS